MFSDRIEGTKNQVVGHLQDAVGGLTDDDKTQAKGKLNEST
ncbi:MAG: CsbD family protein, partial [Caulobacteraceae bacterium]